ncbi:MAG: MotA/TolQ/ExbB proton channel family protein [Armatimonadetes bacterium]|nr:MotA/TolQ/ExbB proton channel family protein [Akkermansiaceae bacterium]
MDLLAFYVTDALIGFLKNGGIFMYPLILCSIAGLTAVGFKMMSLTKSRIVPDGLAYDIDTFETRQPAGLENELQRGGSTLARLGALAVKHCGKPVAEISQVVEASAREEVLKMHSGIGVLDVVITIAPLLGLLGTASGLVVIFQGLGATTDHLIIARGIAEALNTTIFGLAIAVPGVIAHTYFSRRIEMLTARMEAVMTGFISVCARQTQDAK